MSPFPRDPRDRSASDSSAVPDGVAGSDADADADAEADAEAFVACREVVRAYGRGAGRTVALDRVDFACARGESVAIVGPSGSGKSTLLHLIGAMDVADGGSVRVDDVDLAALDDRAAADFRLRNVGFVFQFFNLVPALSALENVALPARLAGRRVGEARSRAADLLARVGLSDEAGRSPDELSGGQQQRVAIARALVNAPALLLADEPTGALDRAAADEVLALVRELVSESGVTFLMATHSDEAMASADRIVRIVDGRIVDVRIVDGRIVDGRFVDRRAAEDRIAARSPEP